MILLLTHSQDYFTIDRVMEHLAAIGAEHVRLDTDLLPFFQPISGSFSSGCSGGLTVEFDNGPVYFEPDKVTAVWARRLWPGGLPPGFPPQAAAGSLPAAGTAVLDLLSLYSQAHWINGLEQGRRAESKVLQLHLASRLGLRLPDTLISNNPREVEAFFHHHGGDIVTKLLVPTAVSMQADPAFAYTCRVQAEHLANLEQVRAQPQIFQPFLPKRKEYRAVCVGGRFLVGALAVPEDGPLSVDWRQAGADDDLVWERAMLPENVQHKLLAMMAELGLEFGVFDLIDTGEGEPYFLEVNQAGEWGMLERDLELPVAEAIARELAR